MPVLFSHQQIYVVKFVFNNSYVDLSRWMDGSRKFLPHWSSPERIFLGLKLRLSEHWVHNLFEGCTLVDRVILQKRILFDIDVWLLWIRSVRSLEPLEMLPDNSLLVFGLVHLRLQNPLESFGFVRFGECGLMIGRQLGLIVLYISRVGRCTAHSLIAVQWSRWVVLQAGSSSLWWLLGWILRAPVGLVKRMGHTKIVDCLGCWHHQRWSPVGLKQEQIELRRRVLSVFHGRLSGIRFPLVCCRKGL